MAVQLPAQWNTSLLTLTFTVDKTSIYATGNLFLTFAHRKMPIDFVIQDALLVTLQRLLREIVF